MRGCAKRYRAIPQPEDQRNRGQKRLSLQSLGATFEMSPCEKGVSTRLVERLPRALQSNDDDAVWGSVGGSIVGCSKRIGVRGSDYVPSFLCCMYCATYSHSSLKSSLLAETR